MFEDLSSNISTVLCFRRTKSSTSTMGPNSGMQEYCLRWNNHHSTLVSVMDALLQKGTLVDVTLAAEGKSIQVHRLVLCACSNYFQVIESRLD